MASGLGAAIWVIVLEGPAAALDVDTDADTERALSMRRTLDGPGAGSSASRLEETETARAAEGPAAEADVEATSLEVVVDDDDARLDNELTDFEAPARTEMLFSGGPMGVIATRGVCFMDNGRTCRHPNFPAPDIQRILRAGVYDAILRVPDERTHMARMTAERSYRFMVVRGRRLGGPCSHALAGLLGVPVHCWRFWSKKACWI